VITITLIVFVLQFRGQEKAIREASYQGLMGRYNDYIMGVVKNPAVGRILVGDDRITPEQSAMYGNLLVAYGIIEEAFLLRSRKWITEDEWKQWSAFLASLSSRPEMKVLFERVRGTFDTKFEEYTSQLFSELEEANKRPEKEDPGKKES
jgi:hypothetical protein